MKASLKRTFLLCGVVCLLFSGTAAADIRSGAFTLSPLAGSYYFDSVQNLERRPVYNLGLGYNLSNHWGAELMLGYNETSPKNLDGDIDVYSARVDLLYHFTPSEPATFYFAAGGGALRYEPKGALASLDHNDDALLNYGLGLKAMINDTAGFRFDARHIYTADDGHFSGKENNHFTYTAGLFFQFGGGEKTVRVLDSDHDGVNDDLDQCPGTLLGTTVDSLGCPVVQDTDHDGVSDSSDNCPDTPVGTSVDADGCPSDDDGDGVSNSVDKCPDTPIGTAVDASGCPLKPDADGDGVENPLDKCPGTPSTIPVNERGCPKDSDGDFVFDFEDECPDTPQGDLVDASGCTVKLEQPESVTLDVRFQRGSSKLLPNQSNSLEKAVLLLEKYPNAKIVVEGHTDSTGSSQFNLRLSEQRAESVRQHLLEALGLDPQRVTAKGYGEDRPIAENSTPEGRMKNRRVQITIEP